MIGAVRDAIAVEAGRKSGLSKSAIAELVRRVAESPVSVFPALIRDGIDPEQAVLAAATITGLPPAPRLLMQNPNIPNDLDAIGLRDAGAVPLGTVQGRLWVAFSDPEAAKAAIFSDNVVVCLGLDVDLRAARQAFEVVYPADAGDTQAMAAVTPAQVEAWRREVQAEAERKRASAQKNPLSGPGLKAPRSMSPAAGAATTPKPTTPTAPPRTATPQATPRPMTAPRASTAPKPPTKPTPIVDVAGDISTTPSVIIPTTTLEGAPRAPHDGRRDGRDETFSRSPSTTADVGPPSSIRADELTDPGARGDDAINASLAEPDAFEVPTRAVHFSGAVPGAVEPQRPAAPGGAETHHTATDNDSSINRALDPERLRLLRAAQLGRLRRFKFDRIVGSGGMATVYLAHDRERPGPPVAVKLLDPHLSSDATAVARFRREVRALASLNHPHIVAWVDGDADADAGVLWLACRYVDGCTLRELLEKTGPLPLAAILPIVAALFQAQQHAHGAGVVHRDLKPQNVLLGHDGSICLADFGVASAVGDVPVTRAGSRFGTPAYMAPEQALGGDTDARADLFATGLLLYEMLVGTNPFVRGSREETMGAIARAEVPALPQGLRLPIRLRALLEALLAPARDARPPDARAVLDVIEPFLSQCPPVQEVVKRLLKDPTAWRDAPDVDDDGDRTVGEDVEGAVALDEGVRRALLSDPHSAFGAHVGARATMELPRVKIPFEPTHAGGDHTDAELAAPVMNGNTPSNGEGSTHDDDEGGPTLKAVVDEGGRSTREGDVETNADDNNIADVDDDGEDVVAAFAARERRKMVAVLSVLGLVTVIAVVIMIWAVSTDGPEQAPGTVGAALDAA